MPKSALDYLGYQIGDIITLSDVQTQQEFNEMSVDFRIKEIRTYKEPGGLFTYTGYISEYAPENEEPTTIMLFLRQVDDDFDLFVYYVDQEGPSDDFGPLFKTNPKDPEDEDLVDIFEVDIHVDGKDLPVTWNQKGSGTIFGVDYNSTDTGEGQKTISEYYTKDETGGNPHCFIDWAGDTTDGFLEIWYGCEVTPEDVELFRTSK